MSRRVVNWNIGLTLLISTLLSSGCILIPDGPYSTEEPISTEAPTFIPPTATSDASEPTKTVERTPTEVMDATETPLPADTETPTPEPTATVENTPTPFPYTTQPSTPAYIANFAHPEKGCEWMGVAGQVFGSNDEPVLNIVVAVTGKLDDKTVEAIGITGTESGDVYGPGGYEIVLSDSPLHTEGIMTIQLFNLNGIPISDQISFNTQNGCDKNLIIINFDIFS